LALAKIVFFAKVFNPAQSAIIRGKPKCRFPAFPGWTYSNTAILRTGLISFYRKVANFQEIIST
jgi:hypothetical protein